MIRIAALGFALMATAANAQLPRVDAAVFATTPITLSDTISGVTVIVPSRNPVDYGPAMRGELGSRVALTAQLFRPSTPAARHPAVIIVPGSGGIEIGRASCRERVCSTV